MAKPFSKDKKDKDKVSLFPRKDIVKLGIYVKKSRVIKYLNIRYGKLKSD